MKQSILEILIDPKTGELRIIANDETLVRQNIEKIIADLMYKYDALPVLTNSYFNVLFEPGFTDTSIPDLKIDTISLKKYPKKS